MADVTERMLALLTALQIGRRFTGAELSARLGVSARTLRRDVDRLRGYGYPVETQPGPAGYYRLARGTALPPLVLDDDEVVAILSALAALAATAGQQEGGLGAVAAGAYARIEQLLPTRLHRRLAAWRGSVETSPLNAPRTLPQVLGQLSEAVHRSALVEFCYAGRATTRVRTVEPHRIVHRHLAWYLLAWDLGAADWRTFRLDRMSELRNTGTRFTPRPLPAASADEYLSRGIHRASRQVVLTVSAPRDDVALALAYQDAQLTGLDEGTTRVTMHLGDWRWMVLALAGLDADFTVHSPADLGAELVRFGARLTASQPSGCG